MSKQYIDENEIRKTIALLKPNGELFEIRIPAPKGGAISGYFRDAETLISQLKKQNLAGVNVYITLNRINEACYSRGQKDKLIFVKKIEPTTSDSDITDYEWLMIDLDPKRPSGTSSSEEELNKAKALGNKIYQFMAEKGFEKPVTALSGNGIHLLYKLNMPNSDASKSLIEKTLKTLDVYFSTDEISVDCSNFNPARTCKLYGTLAQKGIDDADRKHRMSYVVGNPSEIKPTDAVYFMNLLNMMPHEPEKPQNYNKFNPKGFDVGEWLTKYGLAFTKRDWKDAEKFNLDHCPFNENHTNGEACVIRMKNGALKFHCFHNSCSDKDWKDLRMKFEPDAYEKGRQEMERRMYKTFNRDVAVPVEPKKIVPEENEPVLMSELDVLMKPQEPEYFVRTGIKKFDDRCRGLQKGFVTVISGYTGGSKSTLLSQIMLNAVDDGNNVACFSGELSDKSFFRWWEFQAAGKAHLASTQYEGYYNIPYKIREKIANWTKGHFWLYNNYYGYNFNAIIEELERQIDEKKLDLICLDNLMALDITDLGEKKFDAQGEFARKLHFMAMEKNVHIIAVCHPKKPVGILRTYDISGASEIVNYVDNVLFVYRVEQNFKGYYKAQFGKDYAGDGSNCWHLDKARNNCVDDSYNDLYYERETKRLKNTPFEYRKYGWESDNTVNSEAQSAQIETPIVKDGEEDAPF